MEKLAEIAEIGKKKEGMTARDYVKLFGIGALALLVACGGERQKYVPKRDAGMDAWAGVEDMATPDLKMTPDLSQGNIDMCTRVGQNACPCTKGEASCTWCGCFRNDAGDQPPEINAIWMKCLQGDRDAKIFCDGLVQ